MEKFYKEYKFEQKSFHEDDEFFFFNGHLSTFFDVDRGDDVVERGAFAESLKEHTPPLLWSHKTHEPLGIFPIIKEDEIGLFVEGKMPKKDTLVSGRIIPQIKIGSISSMSIGFSIENWETDISIINGIRHLRKIFLWEGSLVVIPMNENATIKSLKTAFEKNKIKENMNYSWSGILDTIMSTNDFLEKK